MPDSSTGERPDTGRTGGRGQTIALIVVAVVLTAVVGWFAVDRQQQSKGQAAIHSYDNPADGVLPVTVEVDRDPDTALTCELIAVDDRQIIVGQLDLEIPPGGDRRQRIDADIPLRGDGIAPELIGCTVDD
ncbi:DUF4307 domain-containing protein [Phytoactinopolyspora halotolerans]|uniref:DUF4307 domain-containing protein n=1 Tax=Phytoactinopolyspora halotolerans TaxID=1981512 RepID=A0A6L9S5M7_9ACTN|nr:DUF4307 domain-containing protein [Phytoactinopolyspora halotolerans]NED99801.1 DUF4307 domain-containing protein [Phytoactinopolyspora halotolerans]